MGRLMCACEPGFVCRQCAGTPFDPNYLLDEPEPLSEGEFDDLLLERRPIIMLGEES